MESQGSFGNRKRKVYHQGRESDENQGKRSGGISRRTFLKAAVVSTLAVGGALAARKGLQLAEQAAVELGTSYEPTEVYAGKVTILKGVNVRKSPNIPDSGGGNTVDWGDIKEVNGVPILGADSFEVDNPQIYRGYDPRVSGPGPQDSPWIKLNARTGNIDRNIFINMGGLTASYVKTPDEYRPFVPLEKDPNGQWTAVGHGVNLSANQIGIVKINSPK